MDRVSAFRIIRPLELVPSFTLFRNETSCWVQFEMWDRSVHIKVTFLINLLPIDCKNTYLMHIYFHLRLSPRSLVSHRTLYFFYVLSTYDRLFVSHLFSPVMVWHLSKICRKWKVYEYLFLCAQKVLQAFKQ